MADMEFRTLGNTGVLVSRLCLGTMTFSGRGFFKVMGTVDQKGADELVKASIDAGINFFDTADEYSTGGSEITLGQSFKNLNVPRKDYILATKVFSRVGEG
jgi:aryl-alcohol dehydrogenase-like predicted oxidoreductase